jgi:hypothetical protein
MSAAENNTKAAPRRVPGRPFARGQTGNPGGRPQHSKDIAELARTHSVAAIAALAKALNDPKTRVPAAVAILNRGHGLPLAKIEGITPQSITVLHLIAAKEIGDEIARALAANGDAAPMIDGNVANGEDVAPIDLMKPALE